MLVRFGVGDASIEQPGVQLLVARHSQPRREEALAHYPDLVLDLPRLPTRGRRAGGWLDQVMPAHPQKAAVELAVFADEHGFDRRLHVVVDAASAGSLAPDVEVRIVSAPSPGLVEQLRAGELDMALMRQVEDATDLHFELVGSHRIVIVLPADHGLARKDAVSFEDLRDQTYIAVSRRAAPAVRSAVDAWCQQQGLILIPSHSADNIASGIALILTTRGFSLMPDYAERLTPPEVRVRPLVDEPHPIPLFVAY
jgi:hypothetical protein